MTPADSLIYDGTSNALIRHKNVLFLTYQIADLQDDASSDRLRSSLSSALAQAQASASTTPGPSASQSLASSLLAADSPLQPGGPAGLAFARTLEVPYGVILEDVALRWYGWANSFGGSDAAPVGGFQRFIEAVLADAQLHGADVRLGALVSAVAQTPAGVTVRTGSSTDEAKCVICTIPLGVLQHTAGGLFDPPLPTRRMATIAGTHVGVLEKLVLSYPSAWWPQAATAGSFTFLPASSGADKRAASGPAEEAKRALEEHTISVASFAAPSFATQHPTLLFYLSPSPALALARFSEADAARGAHAFLVARFGVEATSAPEPLASAMTEWHKDPLARGATSAPSGLGEERGPLDFVELGKPLWGGALCFAGEHTDADHRGSVAGAVISGLREAERVHLYLQRDL